MYVTEFHFSLRPDVMKGTDGGCFEITQHCDGLVMKNATGILMLVLVSARRM